MSPVRPEEVCAFALAVVFSVVVLAVFLTGRDSVSVRKRVVSVSDAHVTFDESAILYALEIQRSDRVH